MERNSFLLLLLFLISSWKYKSWQHQRVSHFLAHIDVLRPNLSNCDHFLLSLFRFLHLQNAVAPGDAINSDFIIRFLPQQDTANGLILVTDPGKNWASFMCQNKSGELTATLAIQPNLSNRPAPNKSIDCSQQEKRFKRGRPGKELLNPGHLCASCLRCQMDKKLIVVALTISGNFSKVVQSFVLQRQLLSFSKLLLNKNCCFSYLLGSIPVSVSLISYAISWTSPVFICIISTLDDVLPAIPFIILSLRYMCTVIYLEITGWRIGDF